MAEWQAIGIKVRLVTARVFNLKTNVDSGSFTKRRIYVIIYRSVDYSLVGSKMHIARLRKMFSVHSWRFANPLRTTWYLSGATRWRNSSLRKQLLQFVGRHNYAHSVHRMRMNDFTGTRKITAKSDFRPILTVCRTVDSCFWSISCCWCIVQYIFCALWLFSPFGFTSQFTINPTDNVFK